MTQSSTLFDRIDQAAKLSRQLTGKAAARTVSDAFVTERIADIKALHQSGVPLARYARLVAPTLGVRPSALLDALRRAGFISAARSSTKADTRSAPSAPSRTASVAEAALTQPAAKQAAASPLPAPAAPTPPGTRSRSHPTLPNVELPDWADWSDQAAGESDADYIFRKALEMPPETQRKFIGEHQR